MKAHEKVYALVLESSWANIPDRIVGGSFDPAELEPKTKDSTYDGVFAETRGKVVVRELVMPGSIRTLIAQGATIGTAEDGSVALWFDGKRYAGRVDRAAQASGHHTETWNREESMYLIALAYANGEPEPHVH
jgi:hypothetical protein